MASDQVSGWELRICICGLVMRREKSNKLQLTAVDLFSGCGGLTTGLKIAGFKVLAAVEADQTVAEIYRKNHRSTLMFQRDITELTPTVLMQAVELLPGKLDLLAGCPPCQGFSSLRTRNGASRNNDRRNALVHQIVRFAKILKPKAIMLENVPRLLTHSSFKEVQSALRKLGYRVESRIENASDFGVPQRRKRLIMLATRNFSPRFAERNQNRVSVRQAIGGLPPPNSSSDKLHTSDMSRRSKRVREIIAHIPKDGGSRKSLPKRLQLKCHRRAKGFSDVYGRMSWDDVSPTITGGCYNPSKGRFLHPIQDRPITLREAALLQGFPPKYYFDPSIGQQPIALMIGNALPPPFVAQHAKVVARLLRSDAKRKPGAKAGFP